VRFKINQEALAATLAQVVASVEVPKLPEPEEQLRQAAIEHLINHVLPRLQKSNESLRGYLRSAVEHFYIDQTKKAHPKISFGEFDVGDDVVKLDDGARIHLEWMFENQPDLVRELHNANELDSYLEDRCQQARDLFTRLREHGLSEQEASKRSVEEILEPRDGPAMSNNPPQPLPLSEQERIRLDLISQKFSYSELHYIQQATKAVKPDATDKNEEDEN
jgi:hypothetical protein